MKQSGNPTENNPIKPFLQYAHFSGKIPEHVNQYLISGNK
jgi:hypothetical protein